MKRRNFGAGLRPRKMKQIELTVLSRDVDGVIEYLGRQGVMHFSEDEDRAAGGPPETGSAQAMDEAAYRHIRDNLDKLQTASAYLGLELPKEPDETSRFPGETEEALTDKITAAVSSLSQRENEQNQEQRKIEEALTEAKAFTNLNAPFADLDQLSYLTLRVGRLDPRRQDELKEVLADRAVIIPLDSGSGGDRVLAAASRKGRFALDSELKRANFVPIAIPEGYKGVPAELFAGLEERLKEVGRELEDIRLRKRQFRDEYGSNLRSLTCSYLMAGIMEQLKARLVSTKNVYFLTGWVPADVVPAVVGELEKLTEGRIAVRSFNPEEVPSVREGKEKVPVSLDHGAFVKGFEGVVFSYGAPLYGTIDPTPLVAVFFTVLFGIMFGDLGQGFILFLAGLLTGRKGPKFLSGFRKFSVPLVAVGISSMIMGLLNGEVFTHEGLLVAPTEAVTRFLTGRPMERILTLMPLPEKGGSVIKLFYFFGFTIGVGVILNSAGLIVNIVNQYSLKEYEKAFFAKTGAAGAVL
ncbi:MAG: V-type ATP synthase subunit I, partial [Treponema sp.]|nr:V-type ATP synthase subunit I [Treponema sp.]